MLLEAPLVDVQKRGPITLKTPVTSLRYLIIFVCRTHTVLLILFQTVANVFKCKA